MAIKLYKPTSPARRGMTSTDLADITAKKPLKTLLAPKKSTAGRNNKGRITTRHRGGGAKRFYRMVDFKLPVGTAGVVEAIEYDPNRSARIARVKLSNGQYCYVLAASKMTVGQKIASDEETPIKSGNRMPLRNIPEGSNIYSIELKPGAGGQIGRSAGSKAVLMAKEGKYGQIRLPSGEIRLIDLNCMANLGSVGNEQHQNVKIGSAGRNRHLGKRPSVRGKAMNAVDHPHGGGDGGAHGVGREPKTPWGQKTLGFKTRRRKDTSKYIVKSRHAAKRR